MTSSGGNIQIGDPNKEADSKAAQEQADQEQWLHEMNAAKQNTPVVAQAPSGAGGSNDMLGSSQMWSKIGAGIGAGFNQTPTMPVIYDDQGIPMASYPQQGQQSTVSGTSFDNQGIPRAQAVVGGQ